MAKLLFITQKIDLEDDVLGTYHHWIEKLSEKVERINVICLYRGKVNLPRNVSVYSLGKDKLSSADLRGLKRGFTRIKYIVRFWKYIWNLRNNYDLVFVHMNPIYIILGGWFWKLWGKKIFLWYNHPMGNLAVKIGIFFSKKVFCTSCYAFAAKYKKTEIIPGQDLPPAEIVKIAEEKKLPSISYTYTEPTIFSEYALDVMKIAKKKGLKNIWVSNGFMSEESAKMIIPYLDANNIDIKGFSDEFYQENCGARLQPILDICKLMKKSGVWVEITTLAIPTLSDSKEMFLGIAKFIHDELGPETPWHISAFSGEISWKLRDIPDTPFETLEMAYKIGKDAGLKYVYTGNVPGMPSEDTFCPKCKMLVIDRTGYVISRHDKKGKCSKCREDLNLILK